MAFKRGGMADNFHGSPRHEPTLAETRNARRGLVLFAVYLAAYAGFVIGSAFWPNAMGAPAWAGVNVAILYGLGLIVGAGVLAVVYMLLCRDPAAEVDRGREPPGGSAREPRR